jgi:hypothetical protein
VGDQTTRGRMEGEEVETVGGVLSHFLETAQELPHLSV